MTDLDDHSGFERRAYTRVPLHLAAEVNQGGSRWQAQTSDVSFQGFFLTTDRELAIGTIIHVAMHPVASELAVVEVDAEVVASRSGGLACRIDVIHDPDSFANLRRYILYNAEDPDQAEREITRRIGGEDTAAAL